MDHAAATTTRQRDRELATGECRGGSVLTGWGSGTVETTLGHGGVGAEAFLRVQVMQVAVGWHHG
jgi:hypothetical protein